MNLVGFIFGVILIGFALWIPGEQTGLAMVGGIMTGWFFVNLVFGEA